MQNRPIQRLWRRFYIPWNFWWSDASAHDEHLFYLPHWAEEFALLPSIRALRNTYRTTGERQPRSLLVLLLRLDSVSGAFGVSILWSFRVTSWNLLSTEVNRDKSSPLQASRIEDTSPRQNVNHYSVCDENAPKKQSYYHIRLSYKRTPTAIFISSHCVISHHSHNLLTTIFDKKLQK